MMQNDQEKEYLRENVSCAVVLERMPPVWQLDIKESTRDSLKYRRGEHEIVIVNHGGRGWWDPKSTAKGDVFSLVQYLDPGLNFGAVRRVLRPLAGLAPEFPAQLPDYPCTRGGDGCVKNGIRQGTVAAEIRPDRRSACQTGMLRPKLVDRGGHGRGVGGQRLHSWRGSSGGHTRGRVDPG